MRRDFSLIELTINIFIFIIVIAVVLQLIIATNEINITNEIDAKSTLQLINITSILDNPDSELDDYYTIDNDKIYFDEFNQNVTRDEMLYYIEIIPENKSYTLGIYDKYDNVVDLLDYEVVL